MRNISNIDYSKLKKEYIKGNISYRELAKKHGVPFGTLRKVAAKQQWTQLRTQTRIKADTKVIDIVSDMEANRTNKIIDVADKLLDKIYGMLDMESYNTQNIKNLTSALKDLKEIKGFKSAADMREQEARIAKLQKEAQEDNDTAKEIEIVFNAGPGEWNE